jgi:predicted nucleic acid-binding protein
VRILLDTSAYVELYGGNPAAVDLIGKAGEIIINPVFLGEVRSGLITGIHSEKRRAHLESFLALDRVGFVPIDQATSDIYAEAAIFLRNAGTPVPTNDLWLAASAIQHGLKVITTDRHFLKIPQVMKEVFDPT